MGNVVDAMAFQPPLRNDARWREHPSTVHVTTEAGNSIPVCALYPKAKSWADHRSCVNLREMCIIYCHGNAEDLGHIWPHLQRMALHLGLPVYGFDYPGYGTADGISSEAGCYAAAEAVWAHVRNKHPHAEVVVYGRSLGSGPAVHLATQPSDVTDGVLCGLVLQSPLASGVSTVLGRPGELLLKKMDIMRNVDRMSAVNVPVCIMHGTKDSIVPWSHGKRLHALSAQPHAPLWAEGLGHNNMPPDVCNTHVANFLAALNE